MSAPALLRMGWPRERVETEHRAAAHRLAAAGYEVHAADRAEADAAEHIIARLVMDDPEWRRPDDNGTLVAVDAAGRVAAALMMTAWQSKTHGLVTTVRALAVETEHRGRELGLALMALLPAFVAGVAGREPDATHGSCAEDAARFYQRAGCSVLRAGERLPLRTFDVVNDDERYPCQFFRDW